MLINAYWDSPHGRNIDWSVFVYNAARLSNRTFQREREREAASNSQLDEQFSFFFYGDQLLFSGFTDSLPLTFLIHACCDFYQTTFGLKMSHLSTRNEKHGRGKSHKNDVVISSCCPLSSFITSSEFSFSSGHDAFSVPPNVRGGWWRRGPQRANPAGKSELSLFV